MYVCFKCLCDTCEYLEVCKAPGLKKERMYPQPCAVCIGKSKKNSAFRYMPIEYGKCEHREKLDGLKTK